MKWIINKAIKDFSDDDTSKLNGIFKLGSLSGYIEMAIITISTLQIFSWINTAYPEVIEKLKPLMVSDITDFIMFVTFLIVTSYIYYICIKVKNKLTKNILKKLKNENI